MVSVVILQHQLPGLAVAALQSVIENEMPGLPEIILIDNGSPYADREPFRELDFVHLIELPANRGFVSGLNAGWSQASGDFILLCNNDVTLAAHCLPRLVRAMQMDPDLGLCAACYQAGPWKRAMAPVPLNVTQELAVSDGQARAGLDSWSASLGDEPQIDYVGATETTVFMVRKAASDQLGFFDPQLPYLHETDYALRLQGAGYRTAYCRNAVFWHSTEHPTIRLVTGGLDAIPGAWDASTHYMNQRWGARWKEIEH